MDRYLDIEDRIHEIGRELYGSVDQTPPIFDKKRWMGRLIDRAMRDEEFKIRLLRYIDVLPSLKDNALVVRLLSEYFSDLKDLPPLIRSGIRRSSRGIAPLVTGAVIKAGVRVLAGQFIAGSGPAEALKPLKQLWDDGFAGSIDLLGEEVLSNREAEEFAARYLGMIDLLAPEVRKWKESPALERDNRGEIPRLDISFKASSFYCHLDPVDWEGSIEKTRKNLGPVIARAAEAGASVCFDMEHYYCKDLIIAVFKSVLEDFRDYHFAGIVLQTYLKDTRADLLNLIGWARDNRRRITIRLVKGAYWDYEVVVNRQKGWPVPVFMSKEETDRSFEELTRILLENSEYVRPAVASHNVRSISNAIAAAEALGLPKDAFEFQMLYGMGDPLRHALSRMNYRVRLYTPVGELIPGMAYLVRRLLENTANVSFLREIFAEKRPFEDIIRPPGQGPPPLVNDRPDDSFRNEPPLDFSKAGNRERMKDALLEVRRGFGRRYPLYIGNEDLFTDKEIHSFNPADPREIVGRVSYAGREHAELSLKEAKKAWTKWREVPPEKRADYLFRAAEIMRGKRFELAALEVFEVGKTWKDADGDITEAMDYLEYYGREMIRLGKPVRPGDYPGEENEYLYVPRGIGAVISPWNFPLAIAAGMVSAAIVTGNCVIFKPSGLSPVTGRMLVDAFRQAGLPPGVLQFLPGPGSEVGEYLVSHRDIDFVSFTGSRDVGLRIVKLAGETAPGQRNVKKMIAEMGGKNAIIVDETAELDETVKAVVESFTGYQGQKCSACSRVIVVGEVFDEFCRRLKNAAESIPAGPPEHPGVLMGPVIDDAASQKIRGYIEGGAKWGKELLVTAPEKRNFIGPAIFTGVDAGSPLAQEEIFGPVLAVIRAKDTDEAIDMANSTDYALTGGIFSRGPSNIKKTRERFRVGNLYLNRKITGALVGRQPFGGFGMSGVGSKAGGPDYLIQFMNPVSFSENTMRRGFAPLKRSRG